MNKAKEIMTRFEKKTDIESMSKDQLSTAMEEEYAIIEAAKSRLGRLEAEAISRYAPELVGQGGYYEED